jgi:hypothetical protein
MSNYETTIEMNRFYNGGNGLLRAINKLLRESRLKENVQNYKIIENRESGA